LTRFTIQFAEQPPRELLVELVGNPNIYRPNLQGRKLEFFARERHQLFAVIKQCLAFDPQTLDMSHTQLQDLFIGLTEGEL